MFAGSIVPTGLTGRTGNDVPGDESPGYYQMSLRDMARAGDGTPKMWVTASSRAVAHIQVPGNPEKLD